ncbi:MAG: DEAD/DEAH box helicase [Pirellulaceae bacterium]
MTTTKQGQQLTLRDRLSRLTFTDACKLLGEEGRKLIQQGGKWDIKIEEDVYLGDDLFRLKSGGAIVTITPMAEAKQRLHWHCDQCSGACIHAGAAFSLILEEKTALGLAAAPPEKKREPVESLREADLVQRAIDDRLERAKTEKMKLHAADADQPWTDYTLTNALTGKTYRVALRGAEPGQSYCSCPDFRTNTLGTCKHVLHVLEKVKRKFPPQARKKPFKPKHFAVHLKYGSEMELRLEMPEKLNDDAEALVGSWRNKAIASHSELLKKVGKLEALGYEVTIYPDAEEFIQKRLYQQRIQAKVAEIRLNPHNHPLRKSLLKAPLLPYQMDGVAFAVGAGRAVLADDMGLGKTIQAVGVAEMLAREANIKKVLIVCPASLKSQWRNEIHKFCDRDVQLVSGGAKVRGDQYQSDCFFTACNYEQVLRDILFIERAKWDLIILDEGQRIKNYETKTSNVIKCLKSPFALVLSGTPLENRLDDLYSVVQFIDDRRLGPGFRFFNQHRVVDEKGKTLGYKNLASLRENLKPLLLRRTRDSVKLELPPRTVEIIRIPPSDEQLELHATNMRIVASIVRKAFISEMDLLRLRQGLLMCRMAADSSFLCTKKDPSFSTKLDYLAELFDRLFEEEGRKVVLFSEWTTMLNLIEPLLKQRKLPFVRLDGSVPQKQRQAIVHEFQNNPECKAIIMSNAGSQGLNLQAANTVINVDLPWNPAILEQRIGRAHRMGQTQPVQVYVLVTEKTLEENLLGTLSAKKDLALAALDVDSETDEVDVASGMDELKSRLEILLGAKQEAPVDESVKLAVEQETQKLASSQRERVAAAGGELLGAAFQFLGELIAANSASDAGQPAPELVSGLKSRLEQCVDQDASGKPRLTITLPDKAALDNLAQTLAKLLAIGAPASG